MLELSNLSGEPAEQQSQSVPLDNIVAGWFSAAMPSLIALRTDSGFTLNATVEISASGLIFHSRSGTDRNRDYRQALELLMGRLDSAGITYQVYLDSRPVQHIPLAERRLQYDQEASAATRFDQLVRSMNANSSSHGAWRRLLIMTPGADAAQVRRALESSDSKAVERIPAAQLRQVASAHIHRATARLLAGEDVSNFSPSRDYDALTDEGVPLAPKKVFALALEEALGIKAQPGHFSAGWKTVCFELLETAGLWIVPKAGFNPRPNHKGNDVELTIADIVPTEEERAWIEGNPRIVSHLKRERQPGLAKQKRAEFIAEHGRLFCEDCLLDPVEKYGPDAGPACIEVHHHRVHVADMQPGHSSLIEDLKCLCASCHRVLHRRLALGTTG